MEQSEKWGEEVEEEERASGVNVRECESSGIFSRNCLGDTHVVLFITQLFLRITKRIVMFVSYNNLSLMKKCYMRASITLICYTSSHASSLSNMNLGQYIILNMCWFFKMITSVFLWQLDNKCLYKGMSS